MSATMITYLLGRAEERAGAGGKGQVASFTTGVQMWWRC